MLNPNRNLLLLCSCVTIGLVTISAFADKEICQTDGSCKIIPGSCLGHYPRPPHAPTCTDQLNFNPRTDYLEWQKGGKGLLVTPTRTWKVGSDNFIKFLAQFKAKYGKQDVIDKQLQARIDAEFKAFEKKDDGIVSEATMSLLSKETNLKIRKTGK